MSATTQTHPDDAADPVLIPAEAYLSADYARDTRSSVVDAPSTMITDGTLLKVYAWYDNEMGYACRMVDLACHMRAIGI